MKYFSIDYRSPPSGMGQIIDTRQPRMIGDKYNFILVDYGTDDFNDPYYIETKYFHTAAGWGEPIINEIIQYLQEQGVSHVYDAELDYQMGMSQHLGEHYYPVSIWKDIVTNGKPQDPFSSVKSLQP